MLYDYLLIKMIHIISSVVMVGTGFGTAFFFFFANRSGNIAAQAVVGRLVCRADWWFTTPAVIVQPITGVWLAHLAGFPLATPWLTVAMCLYVLAGMCWLPVVLLQINMAQMAKVAHETGSELPAKYWLSAKWWEGLGYPAFVSMAGVFYLMVNKPDLW
ncbi:MAG: DUF2269 family protein [Formosimonas sp.]